MEEHGHCEICSRTVKLGERFCDSPECFAKHEQLQKDKKKQMYLFIALIVATVLFTAILR